MSSWFAEASSLSNVQVPTQFTETLSMTGAVFLLTTLVVLALVLSVTAWQHPAISVRAWATVAGLNTLAMLVTPTGPAAGPVYRTCTALSVVFVLTGLVLRQRHKAASPAWTPWAWPLAIAAAPAALVAFVYVLWYVAALLAKVF